DPHRHRHRQGPARRRLLGQGGRRRRLSGQAGGRPRTGRPPRPAGGDRVTLLRIVLIFAASVVAVGVLAIVTWLIYAGYLGRVERGLASRKGLYRDVVAGLAQRERALLEPELHQLRTLRDFEALEALLEEQARGFTERPAWLLDTYDRLGLVDKYVERIRTARKWRERAFAAELLGRVGNAKAVPALLETIQATRSEDGDVREIALR